jgi:hypothetical protein
LLTSTTSQKLHNVDQERRGNVQDESVKLTRKLAIDLVHHAARLEERIAKLEGKGQSSE